MQCFVISSYIALHDFSPSNITMSCHVVSCRVMFIMWNFNMVYLVQYLDNPFWATINDWKPFSI